MIIIIMFQSDAFCLIAIQRTSKRLLCKNPDQRRYRSGFWLEWMAVADSGVNRGADLESTALLAHLPTCLTAAGLLCFKNEEGL